jgi:hypothetical protein
MKRTTILLAALLATILPPAFAADARADPGQDQRAPDPRTGDDVYRLTAIRREEPAASLFTPPPDYTIRDRGPDVHTMEKQAP